MNSQPLATIFAVPKPFVGHEAMIQRNAVASWKSLDPAFDIWLMGDEPGIAEAAEELGVNHWPHLERNAQGTPLVSSAFRAAHQVAWTPVLVYCNADVILLNDFARAVERLRAQTSWPQYLAIGQRIDLDVDRLWDFDSHEEVEQLVEAARRRGRRASIACKEFFVFPHGLYQELPDFAVGRGNWDNWMVYHAKRIGAPVVSMTRVAMAIHQNHDYGHVGGSRWAGYVAGPEARQNQRLAEGRHLISGSTTNWEMTENGFRKKWSGCWDRDVWCDFPRFFRLLLSFGTKK